MVEQKTEKDGNCGGCRGEGSHRRWCRVKVGPSASIYGPMSEELERMGDRVGPNNFDLTNRLYALSADMREWALSRAIPPDQHPTCGMCEWEGYPPAGQTCDHAIPPVKENK